MPKLTDYLDDGWRVAVDTQTGGGILAHHLGTWLLLDETTMQVATGRADAPDEAVRLIANSLNAVAHAGTPGRLSLRPTRTEAADPTTGAVTVTLTWELWRPGLY